MGQELTTFKTAAPAKAKGDIVRLTDIYHSRLETSPGGLVSISDARMPTSADCAALKARRNELADAMRPGAADAMAIEVLAMFDGYTSVKLDRIQAKRTAAAYVVQITHLPAWAVERACRECAGRDSPFPVSAGELRAAAEAILQPVRDEAQKLRKILDADVYHEPTADERAKLSAGFRQVLDDLGWDRPLQRPQRSADARDAPPDAAVPEPAMAARDVPPLSDEALAIFNKRGTVAAE